MLKTELSTSKEGKKSSVSFENVQILSFPLKAAFILFSEIKTLYKAGIVLFINSRVSVKTPRILDVPVKSI